MAYATYTDVEARLGFTFSESEQNRCTSLLNRAALMIDSFVCASDKSPEIKQEVSVSMVSRVMADSDISVPTGATQGSMSGLGYSQSWTISGGATGQLYFSKDDKRLLGVGNAIGSYSPTQGMTGISL